MMEQWTSLAFVLLYAVLIQYQTTEGSFLPTQKYALLLLRMFYELMYCFCFVI